jgi:starvation-inducible DNA-binding protein
MAGNRDRPMAGSSGGYDAAFGCEGHANACACREAVTKSGAEMAVVMRFLRRPLATLVVDARSINGRTGYPEPGRNGDAGGAAADDHCVSALEQGGRAMETKMQLQPEKSPVTQAFGSLVPVRLGLDEDVRHRSVSALNRLLAHTLALRDLYKKAHWQTSGATFYELHLLFDKHHDEQEALMDAIAERVQALGGVALALAHDIAEETRLARAPRGVESARNQLRRLVDAHEFVLVEARPLSREAASAGDEGTNDLIVSQVVRTNELQSWFVWRHLDAQKDSP